MRTQLISFILLIASSTSLYAKEVPDIYIDSNITASASDLIVQRMIRIFENYGYQNPLIGGYKTIEVSDAQSTMTYLNENHENMVQLIQKDFLSALKGEKEFKLALADWSEITPQVIEQFDPFAPVVEDETNNAVVLESSKIFDYLPRDVYESLFKGSDIIKVPLDQARFNFRIHGLKYNFNNLGLEFLGATPISGGVELNLRINIKSFNIRTDLISFIITLPKPNRDELLPLLSSLISGTEIVAKDLDTLSINTTVQLLLEDKKVRLHVKDYDKTAIQRFFDKNLNATPISKGEACPEDGHFTIEQSGGIKLNISDLYISKRDFAFGNIPIKMDTGKARCFIRAQYSLIRPLLISLISHSLEGGIIDALVESINQLEWDRSYWVDSTTPDEYSAGLKSYYFLQNITGENGQSHLEAHIPSDFCNTDNYVEIDEKQGECTPKLNIPKPKRTIEEFIDSKALLAQTLSSGQGNLVMSMGEDLINRMLFWMSESRFFEQDLREMSAGDDGESEGSVGLSLGPKSVQVRFDNGSEIFKVYLDLKVALKNKAHIFLLGTDEFRLPLVFEASAGLSGDTFDETSGEIVPHFRLTIFSLDLTDDRLFNGAPEVGLPGLGSKDNNLSKIFRDYVKNELIKTLKPDMPLILTPKDRQKVEKLYKKYLKNKEKIDSQVQLLRQEVEKLTQQRDQLPEKSKGRKKLNQKIAKNKKEIATLLKNSRTETPVQYDFEPIDGLKGIGLETTTFVGDGKGRINVVLDIKGQENTPALPNNEGMQDSLIWEGR